MFGRITSSSCSVGPVLAFDLSLLIWSSCGASSEPYMYSFLAGRVLNPTEALRCSTGRKSGGSHTIHSKLGKLLGRLSQNFSRFQHFGLDQFRIRSLGPDLDLHRLCKFTQGEKGFTEFLQIPTFRSGSISDPELGSGFGSASPM